MFGAGNADAELMFVGEAPGASEDEQGVPFVGRAGKLLETLLGEIGHGARGGVHRERAQVPAARQPRSRSRSRSTNCQEYLLRQVELIEPTVICTLGNFSTKLLRGDPTGITRLHGQPEVIVLGARAVRLYPIYHPAAALYTPRMLETLREDFARLPELLALGAPEQPSLEQAPRARAACPRPTAARQAAPRARAPRSTSSACSEGIRGCSHSRALGRLSWTLVDVRLTFSLQRRGYRGCVEKFAQVLKSAGKAADEGPVSIPPGVTTGPRPILPRAGLFWPGRAAAGARRSRL